MSTDTALLLVDVQQSMFHDEYGVEEGPLVLQRLQALADRARRQGVPVIYVQHNGEAGEPEEPGTPGWFLHPDLAPQEGEVVVQKWAPNSFLNTTLQEELEARSIRKLVIAGFQTEYCIDTTCRQASALGYAVTLVGNGHSTAGTPDLQAAQIIAHHNRVLQVFGKVTESANIAFA